jgi:excisionase family DNA binding protein
MDFWKLEQLAERWQVSISTLRRMVRDGELNPVRVGRQVRVTQGEVDRIEKTFNAVPAPPPISGKPRPFEFEDD